VDLQKKNFKMKNATKIIAPAVLLVFIAIQFYQPAPNISKGQVDTADFILVNNLSGEIRNTLKTSCYDCHSNTTKYMWYDYIQPARFLVEYHINAGKEELNFSEWATYSKRKQERLLESIRSKIIAKEMPPPSYLFMHNNAELNNNQIEVLTKWLDKQR